MLETKISDIVNKSSKVFIATNVLNVIICVVLFILCCMFTTDLIRSSNDNIVYVVFDCKQLINILCFFIPSIIIVILRFILTIISNSISNDKLLLILSIVLIVVQIVLLILNAATNCFKIFDNKEYILMFVLFFVMVVCFFIVVQYARGTVKNIHSFFIIFNTLVIVFVLVLSTIALIILLLYYAKYPNETLRENAQWYRFVRFANR